MYKKYISCVTWSHLKNLQNNICCIGESGRVFDQNEFEHQVEVYSNSLRKITVESDMAIDMKEVVVVAELITNMSLILSQFPS